MSGWYACAARARSASAQCSGGLGPSHFAGERQRRARAVPFSHPVSRSFRCSVAYIRCTGAWRVGVYGRPTYTHIHCHALPSSPYRTPHGNGARSPTTRPASRLDAASRALSFRALDQLPSACEASPLGCPPVSSFVCVWRPPLLQAPCYPPSQTHPACCPPAPLSPAAMYVLQPPCTPIIRDRRASRNLRHLPSLAPTCAHVRSRSPWCLHIQAALAARIHTHALERTRARAAAK